MKHPEKFFTFPITNHSLRSVLASCTQAMPTAASYASQVRKILLVVLDSANIKFNCQNAKVASPLNPFVVIPVCFLPQPGIVPMTSKLSSSYEILAIA